MPSDKKKDPVTDYTNWNFECRNGHKYSLNLLNKDWHDEEPNAKIPTTVDFPCPTCWVENFSMMQRQVAYLLLACPLSMPEDRLVKVVSILKTVEKYFDMRTQHAFKLDDVDFSLILRKMAASSPVEMVGFNEALDLKVPTEFLDELRKADTTTMVKLKEDSARYITRAIARSVIEDRGITDDVPTWADEYDDSAFELMAEAMAEDPTLFYKGIEATKKLPDVAVVDAPITEKEDALGTDLCASCKNCILGRCTDTEKKTVTTFTGVTHNIFNGEFVKMYPTETVIACTTYVYFTNKKECGK